MKFLIDRCAGHRLAEWLRGLGHEVAETKDRGPDPGDAAILMQASAEGRILVTIDTDFGDSSSQEVPGIPVLFGCRTCPPIDVFNLWMRSSGTTPEIWSKVVLLPLGGVESESRTIPHS
jgi:predicted nuclease of predicted toxin-antitoxin system